MPTALIDDFNELQEDFKLYDEEKNQKLQHLSFLTPIIPGKLVVWN